MKKELFPILASSIGLVLACILVFGGGLQDASAHKLPLLTLLFICEVGFFITAAGMLIAFTSWKTQSARFVAVFSILACLIFASLFAYSGITVWQGSITLT